MSFGTNVLRVDRVELDSDDAACFKRAEEEDASSSFDDDDDDDDDDIFDDEDFLHIKGYRRNLGGVGSSTHAAAARVSERLVALREDEAPSEVYMSHRVKNTVRQGQEKAEAPRRRGLTRDTRATVEQVMDGRTALLLEKLMKWNVYTELYGCVSTGKEANVYLGILRCDDGRPNLQRAVKVYKTSILVFKDRSRYVEGEFRFRYGYGGSANPRKMVRQWAEKEFRNLRRLTHSGLRSPIPIELRGHVIAMTFLGLTDSKASPRLKDIAHMNPPLPLECRLVHGDFSEYNLLFHCGHVYVIDVSQSVENDHPHAIDFLKRDCVNVHNFFTKIFAANAAEFSGSDQEDAEEDQSSLVFHYDYTSDPAVATTAMRLEAEFAPLSIQRLFQFVLNPNPPYTIAEENSWPEWDVEERRHAGDETVMATGRPSIAAGKTNSILLHEDELHTKRQKFGNECRAILEWLHEDVPTASPTAVSDEVFLKTWVTRLIDIEREMDRLECGDALQYEHFLASKTTSQGSSASDTSEVHEQEQPSTEKLSGAIPEGMDPKEWKRLVKEQNREKRKTKLPKHIKKKKCKAGKQK